MFPPRPFATALVALAVLSISGCSGDSASETSETPRTSSAQPVKFAGAPLKRHKTDSTRMSEEAFYAHVLLRVARNAEKYGNHDAARSFYRRARAFAPYDTDVLLGLARSLEKTDEPMEASEAYGAVLAEDENNEQAAAGLARTLEQIAAKSGENPPEDAPSGMRNMSKNAPSGGGAPAPLAGGMGDPQMPEPAAGDSPASSGAPGGMTREFAAAVPDTAGEKPADAGSGGRGDGQMERDVLEAVEWKDDAKGSAPMAGATEPAGVDVAAASPPTAVPGAPSTGMVPQDPAAAAMIPAPDGYRLQLAAFGKRAGAEAARGRLEPSVKDLLGADVGLTVDHTGGKYRIRTTPLGDRAHATNMCARLKSRSIGCFLVKPTGGNRAGLPAPKPAPKMAAAPLPPAPMDPPPAMQPAPAPPPAPMANEEPMMKEAPRNVAPMAADKPMSWGDVKIGNE